MKKSTEQKKILQFYIVFGVMLVLFLVPSLLAAIISIILFCGVTISAYLIRRNSEDGSLTHNHMTFIIRTIWIGSFFASLSMLVGGTYLFLEIDNTPLNPCIQSMLNSIPSSINQLNAIIEPCANDYWIANKKVIIISSGIVAIPILAYFIMRYIRGISRARKGYRISNPKKWF
ncbi:MAG: hypothetical protein KAJ86_05650 [Alphaproteobacteria bacterium]|nr:hypothetical protein [Alphaproteobacteria bacterium]